ncbi:hypothetical protein BTM25_14050 [Actinomadura rubteroloni]|uniref:DUF4350 domain-containing protein n=1 Tax=Actinomadura rubteroloni TaxID=1926885 RepID=A0A2P4UPM3_9ACTN|nr:DUF4350 domain-containing protein [Actinomadura rubteroloni]POM26997.1 hypothetical protein BTM25_14050 [Actinomadura rubteroloni]
MTVPTARQVAGRRLRASRGVAGALLAVVLVAIILAALRPATPADALDPASPGQDGARALAEILRQRGTPLTVARTTTDAAEHSTSDSVVVVTRPGRLTRTDLLRLSAAPGDLVLVAPSARVLAALAPTVEEGGRSYGDSGPPDCPVPAAQQAGTIAFGSSLTYTIPAGATGCYREGDQARLVQVPVGSRTVTVLGSAAPLTNAHLDEEGDAALALNLVGARSSAVWLVPDLPPPGADRGDRSLGDMVPFGWRLLPVGLAVAVVLVALWRMRRFGPVVAEALPVVVRSAETIEGRSRLYRAHHARGSAAEALRASARARLVPLLGLPRGAATDPAAAPEIVTAVARRTTHDEAAVGHALYGPEPADDAALVALPGLLDDLERQVRDS